MYRSEIYLTTPTADGTTHVLVMEDTEAVARRVRVAHSRDDLFVPFTGAADKPLLVPIANIAYVRGR